MLKNATLFNFEISYTSTFQKFINPKQFYVVRIKLLVKIILRKLSLDKPEDATCKKIKFKSLTYICIRRRNCYSRVERKKTFHIIFGGPIKVEAQSSMKSRRRQALENSVVQNAKRGRKIRHETTRKIYGFIM